MCVVCEGEERYMFNDEGEYTLFGYVLNDTYPKLELVVFRNEDGDPKNGYEMIMDHEQVLAYCPVCGKQLCSDEKATQISDIYNALHEKRELLRETMSQNILNQNHSNEL